MAECYCHTTNAENSVQRKKFQQLHIIKYADSTLRVCVCTYVHACKVDACLNTLLNNTLICEDGVMKDV